MDPRVEGVFFFFSGAAMGRNNVSYEASQVDNLRGLLVQYKIRCHELVIAELVSLRIEAFMPLPH